ncbi:YfiR family protein [Ideonella sp. YS5]|uniref:YfiR family protein n=1 Tax=Ideonella sp. YS5 TaxID=3453714 RepID=UPI003EEDA68A
MRRLLPTRPRAAGPKPAHTACGWLLALILAWAAMPAQAQREEPELKARVLFQVMLFVQWPGRTGETSFQFCTLDDTPLAEAMRSFEGRRINDRVFSWRRVSVEQLGACHVAYVGHAGQPALQQQAASHGVLWVGDELGLLDRGAMLNLQVESGKVVFDIGLETLRRSGLDISAKVLRLARYVKES